MNMDVKTALGGYTITLERGALQQAGKWMDLQRKVLIVTDDGVPELYAQTVAKQCKQAVVVTLPQGERTKCMSSFEKILKKMVEEEFTRSDCAVAVGGGVVGDLTGFVAACYMRGIDFYNIPTTVLSQVDSSIGGKTAVDFEGYKNIVGAFWQPKAVLIDPDTLATLPSRQISNGLAEALKMAMTSDSELFELFEAGKELSEIDTVIEKAIAVKRFVVEQDEKENGLRKILNFGHTLAHGIESEEDMERYYHGECVALGMLPMCDDTVRKRVLPILHRMGLPTVFDGDIEAVIGAMRHDKKRNGDSITVVYVPEIGSFEMRQMHIDALAEQIRKAVTK